MWVRSTPSPRILRGDPDESTTAVHINGACTNLPPSCAYQPQSLAPQQGSPVPRKRTVTVNDKMQKGYRYELTAPTGRGFDPDFEPQLTPKEMLHLGIFCGKYMTDCRREFPNSWFAGARLATGKRDRALNYFGVDASQPLSEWRRK